MVNVLKKLRYNVAPLYLGVFCCSVVMAGSDKSVEYIHIENATENNLAHVCVDFPKYAFTVVALTPQSWAILLLLIISPSQIAATSRKRWNAFRFLTRASSLISSSK